MTTARKAAVKQPQDHKPKADAAKVVETTVKVGEREVDGWAVSLRGVTVHVPKEALNDFELLDELGQMQSGEATSLVSLPSLLRRLVGDDFKKAMDVSRDPVTGRVSVESGTNFVLDLFKAINPNG